jgi:hypothetical protein
LNNSPPKKTLVEAIIMKFAPSDYVSLITITLVLIYDFWLARNGESNTLSFRWARWARQWPIIPLLAGILLGHLFFPNHGFCP